MSSSSLHLGDSVTVSNALPNTRPTYALRDQLNILGNVYVITGAGQGLGLAMAKGLVEAGAIVYGIDVHEKPQEVFMLAQKQVERDKETQQDTGSLLYVQVDVRNEDQLDDAIKRVRETHSRLDGLVAAAAIQQVSPALKYPSADVDRMLNVNFKGVFNAARSTARQMRDSGTHGSIVLVASMSGFIANKGLNSALYNSTKAALVQLTRNLAMEWGTYGIRVNSLCPGHVITPMVLENFEQDPQLRETWERENMLGRLAEPEEFKGPVVFLCSRASAYMTGASLIVDGGHTAW